MGSKGSVDQAIDPPGVATPALCSTSSRAQGEDPPLNERTRGVATADRHSASLWVVVRKRGCEADNADEVLERIARPDPGRYWTRELVRGSPTGSPSASDYDGGLTSALALDSLDSLATQPTDVSWSLANVSLLALGELAGALFLAAATAAANQRREPVRRHQHVERGGCRAVRRAVSYVPVSLQPP